MTSFALPAWAIWTAEIFSEYSPFSWVASGFLGIFVSVVCYAIWAWARGLVDRSRYNRLLLEKSGPVDPLEKTFERDRIFINSFCLPANPIIEDKTFIDCEIVGPSELYMDIGNTITDHKSPIVDCVAVPDGIWPNNAYIFRRCVFRGCRFIRTTFLVSETQARAIAGDNYFRWISIAPHHQGTINPDAVTQPQLPESTEEETPPKTPRD